MMKRTRMLLAAATCAAAVPSGIDTEAASPKTTVCHRPTSSSPNTIVVANPAVPAHLGHGDVLGACPVASPSQ